MRIGFQGRQARRPGFMLLVMCLALHFSSSADAEDLKRRPGSASLAYRVSVNQVLVPTSVKSMRTGNFLSDLSLKHFRLYEDGVEQTISYFAQDNVPLSLVILLDTSRSTQDRLFRIKSEALRILPQLSPRDEVMVISFNDEVRIETEFTNRIDKVVEAIRKAPPGGSTCLYHALNFALTERLQYRTGRKAMILFSDGINWSRLSSADETTRKIEQSDVVAYTVFFAAYDKQSLRWKLRADKEKARLLSYQHRAQEFVSKLAAVSGGKVFNADKEESLGQVFSRIVLELRNLYVLGYEAGRKNSEEQFREISVDVDVADTLIRHKKRYRFR